MEDNINIPVMTADVSAGKEKLKTIVMIEPGFHVARLYAITDYGHQYNEKFNKWTHKVDISFEFLGWRQKFYEDDLIARPTVVGRTFTLSMNKKSTLRPFINSALGKSLSDDQAGSFNIYTLGNKLYLVNIGHSEPNSKGDIYENINGIAPYNERMAQGIDLTPHNDSQFYHIKSHGFSGDAWLKMPNFKREKIKSSEEGIVHHKTGGKFEEPVYDNKEGSSTAQAPSMQRQNPAGPNQQASNQKPKFVLIDTSYTKEVWNQSGWSDEVLVEHGKARWETPAQPQAPSGPPAPLGPSGPPAPVSQSFQVMNGLNNNPNLQKLQQEINDGLDDVPY